jgi:hypothetical protein
MALVLPEPEELEPELVVAPVLSEPDPELATPDEPEPEPLVPEEVEPELAVPDELVPEVAVAFAL